MAESPVARRVEDAISEAVSAAGLSIEDITVTPAGKRRVVRIAVDTALGDIGPLGEGDDATPQKAVPALDLDAVADATRAISDALDASDALGAAPYTLEVTSPGVSRPLTLPRHFRRNVGRLVTLVLTDGASVTGRITAAGSDAVCLRVETAGEEAIRTYPLGDVTRGDVQVEFGRADDLSDDEVQEN